MRKSTLAWALAPLALSSVPGSGQTVVAPTPVGLSCAYNSALPTLLNSTFGWVQCDSAGRLIISNPGGSGGGGGTVTQGTSPWVDNISQFGGANVVTGTGPSGAGIPRVTVSSDSFPSIQPVSGTVTANQGGAPWSTTDTNAANTITAPGTAATRAQAVQGVSGATPVGVTGTFFQATQPVSLIDGADATLGSKADAAAGTGNGSVIAQLKQLHLDTIGPVFGTYNTTAPTLAAGAVASLQLDVNGNLKTVVGGTAATNNTQVAGTALGAPTTYGTAPTGVVPGANAFITNRPGVYIGTDGTVVANLGTLNGAATAANQLRNAVFTEATNTAVAASATFTGAVRTLGSTVYTRFNTSFLATQNGTLKVIGCNDAACGAAFVDTSQAYTANSQVRLSVPVVFPYYEIQFVNGTTAGAIYANTSLTAN